MQNLLISNLKNGGLITAVGATNALIAHLIELAGFKTVYATGAGMANMNFNYPDIGLVSMSEMLENSKRIIDAVEISVIADIDNGYGNALNVYRTAKEFSKINTAAIQLEDQVLPKRCGHFDGKKIITSDEMCGKIKAAKDAIIGNTLLIARTDAIAIEGFESAIERANLYKEAGADILFVEAPTSIEQMIQIPKMLDCYTVANMVEGGRSPIISNDELEKMGYNIVLYANATLKAAIFGVKNLLNHIKQTGSTKDAEHLMISMKERGEITKLSQYIKMQNRYKA